MTGMRWRKTLWALMLFLGMSGAVIAEPAVQRVLFIGNSLTYVNSLPAIFEQVAQAQPGGMRYRADMYVRGGATLAQHDKEPALHALLDSGNYQVVVLQERGGNDLCVRPANHWHGDETSCVDHDEMTAPTKPERCLLDKTQVQAIIDGVRRSS